MTNLTIIGGSLKTPTIAERLQDGVTVHQGRNQVTLSRDELARLIEVIGLGHSAPQYTTTTPAKRHAQLIRYPIRSSQQISVAT
jgi:hypothetical protein